VTKYNRPYLNQDGERIDSPAAAELARRRKERIIELEDELADAQMALAARDGNSALTLVPDRAGDKDRDAAIARVRHAYEGGYLPGDVADARISAALEAVTQGDLSRLVSDLPVVPAERRAFYPKPRSNTTAFWWSAAAFALACAVFWLRLSVGAAIAASIGALVFAGASGAWFLTPDPCDSPDCDSNATVVTDSENGVRLLLCSKHARARGAELG
jgi:hypothetical protein